jgi:uncharacterized protein YcaQ
MGLAARSHGLGTAADLADYYRLPVREARVRIAELIETGELREVLVEAAGAPVYMHRAARVPRRVQSAALLSPFDPLIWYRPRASWLFGFDYRIEIYTPQAQRKWGYYVLPFLLDERIAARVDLKADRKAGALLILAAYIEPQADPEVTAAALATELRTLADWLRLHTVRVTSRRGFAKVLTPALRPLQ